MELPVKDASGIHIPLAFEDFAVYTPVIASSLKLYVNKPFSNFLGRFFIVYSPSRYFVSLPVIIFICLGIRTVTTCAIQGNGETII